MRKAAATIETLCLVGLMGVGMLAALVAIPYFAWRFIREEAEGRRQLAQYVARGGRWNHP